MINTSETQETKEYGFQIQLDEDRFVVGVPPAVGNDFGGIYWWFHNKGVDTYVSLTSEALDAMVEIRELVESDQLKDQLVNRIRSDLNLI